MAGNSNSFASRQPAARIGGRRRRLSRHTRIPRSNTAPFLNDEFSSGVSTSGLDLSLGTDLQESVTVIESSQSMMNFCTFPCPYQQVFRPNYNRPTDWFSNLSASGDPTG
jgi:hypothetical protein